MNFATIRMRSVDQPSKDAISKVSKFLCTHRLNQSSIELFQNSFCEKNYVGRKLVKPETQQ